MSEGYVGRIVAECQRCLISQFAESPSTDSPAIRIVLLSCISSLLSLTGELKEMQDWLNTAVEEYVASGEKIGKESLQSEQLFVQLAAILHHQVRMGREGGREREEDDEREGGDEG
eukprot:TRINITY_DN2013_c1_g1_i1.p2 TRINITY_DN2013_c1_g1~~TRINITY_DN2013_c1_g1_i1.p2  ORF type:complete len:116 (-),score=13.55 TRINITY_DN2013_c1_g1_i1:163-510(-)